MWLARPLGARSGIQGLCPAGSWYKRGCAAGALLGQDGQGGVWRHSQLLAMKGLGAPAPLLIE